MSRPGRAAYTRFAGMPLRVMQSPSYQNLSTAGVALLWDIRIQYNGHNNGKLDATWSRLHKLPRWASKRTLNNALGEVAHYGMIERTRKGKRIGGMHHPSLYAITWEPINDFPDKGVHGTQTASNKWQEPRGPWHPRKPPSQKTPRRGRILGPLSPSSAWILGTQDRATRENEFMRASQVSGSGFQVSHGYSLINLPGGTALAGAFMEAIQGIPAAVLKQCGPVRKTSRCEPILQEVGSRAA